MHHTVVVGCDAGLEKFLILRSFVDHLGHVYDAARDGDLVEVVQFGLVHRAVGVELRDNAKLAVNAVQRVNLGDPVLLRAVLTVHFDKVLLACLL